MKWLLVAVVLVVVIWRVSGDGGVLTPDAPTASSASSEVVAPSDPVMSEAPVVVVDQMVMEVGAPADGGQSGSQSDADQEAGLGVLRDPDDPTTWEGYSGDRVPDLGEFRDPDDPSTWAEYSTSGERSIGEFRDPDDPSSWSGTSVSGEVDLGELKDPDDPAMWPRDEDTGVDDKGEPLDPDDPFVWSRENR